MCVVRWQEVGNQDLGQLSDIYEHGYLSLSKLMNATEQIFPMIVLPVTPCVRGSRPFQLLHFEPMIDMLVLLSFPITYTGPCSITRCPV